MDDLDKLVNELIEEMKDEAAQRLKTIKPDHLSLAEQFRKDGTVYVQDISTYVDDKDRLRKANQAEMGVVRYMEDEQGNLPYFIVKYSGEYETAYSTIYYFFYVSYDKRNWSIERSSIQKYGKHYIEPYIFEVNAGIRTKDDDERPIDTLLSKFTRIEIALG